MKDLVLLDRLIEKELYIHYSAKDVVSVSNAINYFNNKYLEEKSQMINKSRAKQLEALKSILDTKLKQNALELFYSLDNGDLLDLIYEAAVADINKGMDKKLASSYTDIYSFAYDYSSLLTSAKPTADAVDSFLNLILEASKLLGQVDPNLVTALTGIKSRILNGTERKNSLYTLARGVSKASYLRTLKIDEYLNNAVDKFLSEGTVSEASFSSTIRNIFGIQLGEAMGDRIELKGYRAATNTVEGALNTLVENSSSLVKATWVTGNGSSSLIGSEKTINDTVTKVDILKNKALTITFLDSYGTHFSFDMALNTSVKWGTLKSTAMSMGAIKLVGGTPINKYLGKMGTYELYWANNILTHRLSGGNLHMGWRALRSSIAASYLNDWMRGSGDFFKSITKGVDDVLALLINGKLYTTLSVIKAIVNSLDKQDILTESALMPFTLSASGYKTGKNAWKGASNNPSLYYAIKRSRATKECINGMTLSATINLNRINDFLK